MTGLKPVEIRSYQGERLGSVGDFRENSIRGPQKVDSQTYRLSVGGLVRRPRQYTYDELLARPHFAKVVTLDCVEGWSVKVLWEGIRVRDLLAEAGVDSAARIVIFRAQDGYSTSFPLDYIMGRDIIMADRMNGLVLPAERGFPFQLVAESKWGYKWIKWITSIELSDRTDFRGYWEQRGYSNDGDLKQPFFDQGR